jgi:amidase
MSTFITRLDGAGSGPRVAVKDIIDVAGVPTTAGSRAVERTAQPASRDAACLAGLRAADARIVGKANLHELAMLPIGTNPWFGTPENPLDPTLIPGGSSSGSAVAVATGEADVALGSDTGGSVRVPSACCGTYGLKTTYGRVSLDGVWPLAPTLDTIGPMATSVGGLVLGMELMEPGFVAAPSAARTIGRIKTAGDPAIETAIDNALQAAGFDVVALDWDGIESGGAIFTAVFFPEVWEVDHALAERDPDGMGEDCKIALSLVDIFRVDAAELQQQRTAWEREFFALFGDVELLALPTLPVFPPRLEDVSAETLFDVASEITRHVALFNPVGVPCTAQPVAVPGSSVPASLQLVGQSNSEELLLATAAVVEAATAG